MLLFATQVRKRFLLGSIFLTIHLGNSVEKVRFFVDDKLATAAILGFDYFDLHVDAILPCVKIVRMHDGYTIPIIRQPSQTKKKCRSPKKSSSTKRKTVRVSPKIKRTGRAKLQPGSATWVSVSTEKEWTIVVEAYYPLYNNIFSLAETGIADVKTVHSFQILIANLVNKQFTCYHSKWYHERHKTRRKSWKPILLRMRRC